MKKKLIMGMTVASFIANPMAVYAADFKDTPTNTNNALEETSPVKENTEYKELEQTQVNVSHLESQQQIANNAIEEKKAYYDTTSTTKQQAEKEKNNKEQQAYQQVLNQHNLVLSSEKDFNQNTETLRLLETDLLTKQTELNTANETLKNTNTRLLEAQKNASLAEEKIALQKQTVVDKQTAYQQAVSHENQAQQDLVKAQEALKEATAAQASTQEAYNLANKQYQEKSNLVVETKKALDEAVKQADFYKDDTTLNQTVTSANNNYQQAITDQTKAKEEAEQLKTVLDEKTQAVATAQSAVQQAQDTVSTKEAEKTALEQELASLTTTADLTKAQEDLDNAQKALKQAQDDYDQANASLTTAQDNLDKLNNDIAEQEKTVASLKAAYDNSITAEANSFRGFLNYVKAQNASNSTLVKAIDNTLDLFKYPVYSDPGNMWQEWIEITQFTHMGEKDDASSLDNIKNSIDMLKITNALRATKNDPDIAPLKVSYEAMAMAIINANANGRHKYGHTGALWGDENINQQPFETDFLLENYKYYMYQTKGIQLDDNAQVSKDDYDNADFIKSELANKMNYNGVTAKDIDLAISDDELKAYQTVGFNNFTSPYLGWYNVENAVKAKYPTKEAYDARTNKSLGDQDYQYATGHRYNLLRNNETTGVAYITVSETLTATNGATHTRKNSYFVQRFESHPRFNDSFTVAEFEQQLHDYQTYLNNTKTNYENAKQQLTDLTSNKSSLENEIQTLQETANKKDTALKQAQSAVETAQKTVDDIKQNGSSTKNRDDLEEKLKGIENKLRDAKNNLAAFQQNLATLTSEKDKAATEYNKQLDEVKEKDRAVGDYKKALDEATETLKQFQDNQKLAQDNLTSKQNAYKKALEEQRKAKNDLDLIQAALTSAITSYTEDQDKVTQASKKYEEAKEQTKAKKEELDEATHSLSELINVNDDVKEALDQKELAVKEVKALEKEKSTLEEKIAEAKKANVALKETYNQNNNTYQRYLTSYNAIHDNNLVNNDSSLFTEYQQAMQLYQQAVLDEANARIAYETALQQASTITQQLSEARQDLETKTNAYNNKLKELFALLDIHSEIQHNYAIDDHDLDVQIVTLENAKSGLDETDIATRLYNKENVEVKVIYDKDAHIDDVNKLNAYANENDINVLDYFTLSIVLKTADGLSSITSLTQPMTFSVDISSYIKPGRTFVL